MRVINIVLWLVFLPLSTLAGFAGRLFGLVLESIRIYFGGHEGYWSELVPVFTSVLFFSATCIRLLPKSFFTLFFDKYVEYLMILCSLYGACAI